MEDPDYATAVQRLGYCEADIYLLHPKVYPVGQLRAALHDVWQEEKKKRLARPPTPDPEELSAEPLDSQWNPSASSPPPPALIYWGTQCKPPMNCPHFKS